MKLEILHCFCTQEPNSGNPAGVVTDFLGNEEEKQKLASKLNLPVTVFMPALEYFYPESQMPLCLHGTLAAAKILLDAEGSKTKTLKTKSGLVLQVVLLDDIVQIQVAKQSTPACEWNKNEVERLLGIQSSDIDLNLSYTIASVGSPKLLIPLKTSKRLETLQPDFEKITHWSRQCGVNGFYVYTPLQEGTFAARGFNPKTGHNEDAATGVAAGALATCLKRNLVVEQGRPLNKPCRILVTYNNEKDIWVGGRVVKGVRHL